MNMSALIGAGLILCISPSKGNRDEGFLEQIVGSNHSIRLLVVVFCALPQDARADYSQHFFSAVTTSYSP